MKKNAVLIDSQDNVITVTEEVPPGVRLVWPGGEVHTLESIPSGHKVAITASASGEVVRKYGHPLGKASEAIKTGAWVHTHNLARSEPS